MTSTSIGDLAQTMANRMQVTRLKSSLGTLTNELSTGKKQDIGTQVRGEYSALSSLEGTMKTLSSYSVAVREGSLMLDAAQVALTNIYDITNETGPNLILASDVSDPAMLQAASQDARQNLSSIVSSLNLSVAGRALFGGTATGNPPLISADAMLEELAAVVLGAATVEDAQLLIDDWFNTTGGGFETLAYQGSDTAMSAIPVGVGETVRYTVTAADQEVRDVLAAFATAALLSEGAFAGDPEAQAALLEQAGQSMLSAEAGFSVLQAEVGTQQSFLEDAKSRIDASRNAYQIALNDIYAAAPYEVATKLEAIALQLETMYAVTSRLSGLSMTEYLR
jgi:flagellar hook-associated protein 3 FlgL